MSLLRTLFLLVWTTFVFSALNGGGGPFASHVVFTFVTAVAVLLVTARRHIYTHDHPHFSPRFLWLHALYAIFCLTVLLSIVFGSTPQYGLSEWLLYVNGGVLMFLFSGLTYTKEDLIFFMKGTIAVVLSTSVIGFYFYTTTPIPRLAGTFLNWASPQQSAFNTYANVLLLVIPASLFLALTSHAKRSKKAVAIFSAALVLASLTLSFSRAAYLSFILVLVPIFLMVKEQNQEKKIAMRFILVVLFAITIFASLQFARGTYFRTTSLFDKLMFSSDEGANSATERLSYWKASVAMIRQNPLLGVGVRGFYFLYPQYQEKFGVNEDHPHNIFLKVGVENGLVAAILLCVWILSIGIRAMRLAYMRLADPKGMALIIGVGASFFHNLLDFNYVVSNYILLAVFTGLFLSSIPMKSLKIHAEKKGENILRFVALCMSVVVVFVAHEAWYNRDLQRARAQSAQEELSLERAQNLIFERDFDVVWADTFARAFDQTPDVRLLEKERQGFALAEVQKSIDAARVWRLGNSYLREYELTGENTAYIQSKKLLCEALRRDPQNEISYYRDFFVLQQIYSKKNNVVVSLPSVADDVSRCGGRDVFELLKEYVAFLTRNEHFTIAGGNPAAAAVLLSIVGSPAEQSSFELLWREKQEEWSLLNTFALSR